MKPLMRLIFLSFFLVHANVVFAGPSVSCSLLSELASFPTTVEEARTDENVNKKMARRINELRVLYVSPQFTNMFSVQEHKLIVRYTEELAEHLSGKNISVASPLSAQAKQIAAIASRHDCTGILSNADGTGLSTTVSAAINNHDQPENASNTGPGSVWSSHARSMPLLLGLLISLIGLIATTLVSRYKKQYHQLRSCNVTGLLVFGSNCTVTNLTKIGIKCAQLQKPSERIDTKTVQLSVAGYKISAKPDWSNTYYLGLIFHDPISSEAVSAIVEASQDEDQLARVAENATTCFEPGCHLSCNKHRMTQLSQDSKPAFNA